MSKFFYCSMLVIIAITAGFLFYTGFGEGIEYALGFFIAIAGGSFIYEKFVQHGEF